MAWSALRPMRALCSRRVADRAPSLPFFWSMAKRERSNLVTGMDPEAGGGEGGIRTPGTFRFNGFQDRRIRPLCHLSARAFSRGPSGNATARFGLQPPRRGRTIGGLKGDKA
jgi:hypothetical protein